MLPIQVKRAAVRETVEALVACLLGEEGLGCPLAGSLMSPVYRGEPAHHIGVLSLLTADSQANFQTKARGLLSNHLPQMHCRWICASIMASDDQLNSGRFCIQLGKCMHAPSSIGNKKSPIRTSHPRMMGSLPCMPNALSEVPTTGLARGLLESICSFGLCRILIGR